jgi:hypothetical protein
MLLTKFAAVDRSVAVGGAYVEHAPLLVDPDPLQEDSRFRQVVRLVARGYPRQPRRYACQRQAGRAILQRGTCALLNPLPEGDRVPVCVRAAKTGQPYQPKPDL